MPRHIRTLEHISPKKKKKSTLDLKLRIGTVFLSERKGFKGPWAEMPGATKVLVNLSHRSDEDRIL